MDGMSAEDLRAEIQATRREAEAEEGRLHELYAESEQAEERQRLRRELERTRARHMEAQEYNQAEVEYRTLVDKDMEGEFTPARPKRPLEPSGMQGSGAASTNCAEMVMKGHYLWKITGFSWSCWTSRGRNVQCGLRCSTWAPNVSSLHSTQWLAG